MNKLISVEYAPAPKKTDQMFKASPICGAVGETFAKFMSSDMVPVRFPLTAPGSYRRLLYNKRDPLDEQQLLSESVLIPRKWLHLVNRTPVSLYTEAKGLDFSELMGQPHYLKINTKWELTDEWLNKVWSHYGRCWAWKKEWRKSTKPLFVEARLYGLDTVIHTYDPRVFKGTALEVIVRPEPTATQLEAGIRTVRCVSDVFIFANSSEFVGYLDGVDIPREKTTLPVLSERYLSTRSPSELRKHRAQLKQGGKPQEEKKDDGKHYYVLPEEAKQVGFYQTGTTTGNTTTINFTATTGTAAWTNE